MFKYDVNHLQEVLINIKRVQKMDQYIKQLEEENKILKENHQKTVTSFIRHGQDLVNNGILEIGYEPYLCHVCSNVVPGNQATPIDTIDKMIDICDKCRINT
tara:strand:- start:15 stop:320 length:306 start_codon:yes stop_codon:yes gene_type:complete